MMFLTTSMDIKSKMIIENIAINPDEGCLLKAVTLQAATSSQQRYTVASFDVPTRHHVNK